MAQKAIARGTAHAVPADLKKALMAKARARKAWKSITPLARNEWICWVISVKTQETRAKHVARAVEELAAGKRRPCCWAGCVHRTDKPMSPSQTFVLSGNK
jgi:uncharacterized protein YdeI (YjbR/CyaY-like superfamily)